MNMTILLIPLKLNPFYFEGMKNIINWGLASIKLKTTTLERFLIFDHKRTTGRLILTFLCLTCLTICKDFLTLYCF